MVQSSRGHGSCAKRQKRDFALGGDAGGSTGEYFELGVGFT